MAGTILMETLTPITQYGVIPQELFDIRLQLVNAALVVDLIPRLVETIKPDSVDTESEQLLVDMGARKIQPSPDFLRLTFSYVDSFFFCGPDETPDLFTRTLERDEGPVFGDQTTAYPLLKVENSKWAKDMIGPLEHFRIVGPFLSLDILGYEPEGEWKIEGR